MLQNPQTHGLAVPMSLEWGEGEVGLKSILSGEKAEEWIPICPPHSPWVFLSRVGSGSLFTGGYWS